MSAGALFIAVFLACTVEAVEATTIVLAAGLARGWRSAAYGAVAAVAVLAVVVAALGPALTSIPTDALRLVIGALLLVFGVQWLRKAVLRAGGVTALHDEDAIFTRKLATAQGAASHRRGTVPDWYGFTLAFHLASAAAGAAILLVGAAGFAVRAPLARVPENALKFLVGVMLTGFGAFWAAEGAGARWPGSDAALLVLLPGIALLGLLLAVGLRRPG